MLSIIDIDWWSLVAILIPLVAMIIKYLMSLDESKRILSKFEYGELLKSLALHAVRAAEAWAKGQNKKPSSKKKLEYAVEVVLAQAKDYGVPSKYTKHKETVISLIESALFDNEEGDATEDD